MEMTEPMVGRFHLVEWKHIFGDSKDKVDVVL